MSPDAAILAHLRRAGEAGMSGAALAADLGISRAAVWARIEELRRLGYEIEASPHRGYTLRKVPDVLHADDLLARLGSSRVIGRDIRVFQETTSTNDVVERLGLDGVAEGIVVFAERQTAGRGRLGRQWISPAGCGLWFSVLLRPKLAPMATTQLTVASAVAVARGIQSQTPLLPQIKWPNDILLNGRKVCGILTELSAELDRVHHVTLGIGLDVNQTKEELPPELRAIATSLRLESGRSWPRADIALAILKELDSLYAQIGAGKFAKISDEWAARCTTLGERVRIRLGDRVFRGTAEALDDEGALLIRTEHGRLERILGGDVSVEK